MKLLDFNSCIAGKYMPLYTNCPELLHCFAAILIVLSKEVTTTNKFGPPRWKYQARPGLGGVMASSYLTFFDYQQKKYLFILLQPAIL
jgi:hypothetical protein